MRKLLAGAVLCAVIVVAGCTPPGSSDSAQPTPTATSASASPTPTPSPSASPTPSVTLPPDTDFPMTFLVVQPLVNGGAAAVVAKLHEVAQGLPVLKVDITKDEARLTALKPDKGVVSYAWRDGKITKADSDIQYLGQATFDPTAFPLDDVARMFDVADLRGVRGTTQSLQVVEYRAGQVLMTVTSRPETSTVFFRSDGTAVPLLGYTSVDDITDGLADVLGNATDVLAVGFSPTTGYFADLPDAEQGVVLNRSRTGGLPTFETRRSEASALTPFDPKVIDPAGLTKAIASFQSSPTQACEVRIDMSKQRYAPVAAIKCGDQTHYADMAGRDMTPLIS